jgi:hypothetical protein
MLGYLERMINDTNNSKASTMTNKEARSMTPTTVAESVAKILAAHLFSHLLCPDIVKSSTVPFGMIVTLVGVDMRHARPTYSPENRDAVRDFDARLRADTKAALLDLRRKGLARYWRHARGWSADGALRTGW